MTLRTIFIPLALLGLTAAAAADEIPFPEGFRAWTHIRSAVIGPTSSAFARFGGMHSIYANPAAMNGYRSGAFPEGSVIVFDNHQVFNFQGAELPAQRRFIDVMQKTNGVWRFSEFDGDSKTVRNVNIAQGEQQCAACHAKSPTDHVYSQYAP
jgi:hypothetical protein